ncbi:MAG: phosphatase PAP2 family protein [Ilumatobacteraceae bacterium]
MLIVAFGLAYAGWFWREGVIVDRISVLIAGGILLTVSHLGRPWRRWARLGLEVALYTLMWFAYETTRGLADGLGFPLQVESVRNIDRVLFLGADPTVWMQRHFYEPSSVRWYDVVASMAYYSHFVVPPAVILSLWIARHQRWLAFMRRFATLLAFACVSFVVFPTAPPWMAGGGDSIIELSALPPVVRSTGRGWSHIGLRGFVHAWETARDWANPVAAMPSLHASFALMIVVYFWDHVRRWWVRGLMALYPVAMSISLVYLGEHYVADILGGAILVWASFWIWRRLEAWWHERHGVDPSGREQFRNEVDPVDIGGSIGQ